MALMMLAQPVTVGKTVTAQDIHVCNGTVGDSETGDPRNEMPDRSGASDSKAGSGGGSGQKPCPNCGYPMRHCLPPVEYKWLCKMCGYSEPR
ncbi:MAG: hypothetical protein A3K67_01505 [Euryarchaeota archaeon RBG_16_62_10]|nr:MAG: hypothetical protein A3K67_01505 [Euryarchaeota archaeon RBG_16_62_10]